MSGDYKLKQEAKEKITLLMVATMLPQLLGRVCAQTKGKQYKYNTAMFP